MGDRAIGRLGSKGERAMADDPSAHLRWDAESLWRQLAPLLPRISVEVLARCESTNSTLIERARAAGGDPGAPVTLPGALLERPGETQGAAAVVDAASSSGDATDTAQGDESEFTPLGRRDVDIEPCLLVAEQQTSGRGRMGRSWISAPGASLTFSLALPLVPRDWSGLSLAVGLALADALEPPDDAPPRIVLKWPNDLWLAGGETGAAKLGGILIETVSVGRRRMCVVGVGLNLLPLPPPLTEGVDAGHACLQSLAPLAAEVVTAPAVLARVVVPLVRALQAFESDGFAPLAPAYARRDLLRGREVSTSLAHPAAGLSEGVDEEGALLLRADGQMHRIVSGEVSVRPAGASFANPRRAGAA